MNLVKLQDDLRMLPMALLDAKAKGQDPNVPAWLATGVLNEKLDAKKRAGLAQGAAKGSLPSVAEQIQQKAGLMALQGQRQQQSQQQMGEQAAQAPTPTAENTPQPEGQPQEEFAAAGGGIARLPVDSRMFDYRGGGIIAFAGDGEEKSEVPKLEIANVEFDEFGNPRSKDAQEKVTTRNNVIRRNAAAREAIRASKETQDRYQETQDRYSPEGVEAMEQFYKPRFTPTAAPVASTGIAPAPAPAVDRMNEPPRPVMANDPRLATPRPQAPRPQAVAPAPAPAPVKQGIEQVAVERTPTGTGIESMLMESLKAKYKAPTLDELKAERAAATPESLRQPAGLEQLARLNEMQKKRDAGASGRKWDEITQSMLGIGLPGGYGAAAMRAGQATTAADEAFAGDQNKLRSAIEAAQRGEATAEQTALLSGLATGRADTAKATEARQRDLAQAYNTVQTAASSKYTADTNAAAHAATNLTSIEVARIHAAATKAAAGHPDATERILARYLDLKSKDPAAAETFMQSVERIKGAGKIGADDKQTQVQLQQLVKDKSAAQDKLSKLSIATGPEGIKLRAAAQTDLDRINAEMAGLIGGIATLPSVGAPPPGAVREVKK